MGQILCLSGRDKKYDLIKINKNIKKYSNNELEDKISEKIVKKNKNVGFSVLYGLATITGVIILCFGIVEPSIISGVTISSNLVIYHIYEISENSYYINIYYQELERREKEDIIIVNIRKTIIKQL